MVVTDVRVYPIENPKGKLFSFARITLDDALVLTGLRLYDSVDGLFVSYPHDHSHKGADYKQIFFPITVGLREAVELAVITEYEKVKI
jgi:stage V sporulation protein G